MFLEAENMDIYLLLIGCRKSQEHVGGALWRTVPRFPSSQLRVELG